MSASRKTANTKAARRPKAMGSPSGLLPEAAKATKTRTPDDKGFQDRLTGMLAWLADKDPVRAARLIGDYLDDLAEELGPKSAKPAKG